MGSALKIITAQELLERIPEYDGAAQGPDDARYFLPSKQWLDEFGEWIRMNAPEAYQTETFDCDDFANWAKVMASESAAKSNEVRDAGAAFFVCGISNPNDLLGATGAAHALNLVLCDDENWYFFEPQSGQSISLADAAGHYDSLLYVRV